MPVSERGIWIAGKVQRAWAPEGLARIPRRPGVVGAFQGCGSLADDVDIGEGFRLVDPHSAVGASEEVVATPVGKLDLAVPDNHRRIGRNKDRTIQQPPITLGFDVRFAPRNHHNPIPASRKCSLDPVIVTPGMKIVHIDHCLLPPVR